MKAPAELTIRGSLSAREIGLWATAAAAVVFAHVAVALAVQAVTLSEPLPDATEAMVVELAQLPFAASQPVDSEVVSEDEPVERTELAEVTEEVVEEEVAEAISEEPTEEIQPEETAEDTPPVEPEVVQEATVEKVEPDVMTEEIIETVVSEVFIPQPRPEKVVEEAKEEPKPRKRVEKPVEKPVEKKTEKPVEKKPQAVKPVKKAETKREAKASAQPAVQSKVAKAQNVDPARWNRSVRSALARGIRSVRGMRGTVHVAFVVEASGSIVSARIIGPSGNGALDSKALSMVRSTRVPPPPPELPSSSRELSIPLDFK